MARPKNPQRTTHLLTATATVVQTRGIAGVTLRPLAAELGVSPRTLLYHFGSKEDLLTEAIRHLRHQQPSLARALGDSPRSNQDAAAVLGETIKSMWNDAKQAGSRPFLALYFELATLTIRDPDQYGAMLRELDQDWMDAITAHLHHSGLRDADAHSLAQSLLLGYRGALHFGLVTGNWDAADDAIGALIEDTLRRINGRSERTDPAQPAPAMNETPAID